MNRFLTNAEMDEIKSRLQSGQFRNAYSDIKSTLSHIAALDELVEKQEEDAKSMRSFIATMTLWIQRHRSHTNSERDEMFQIAYRLYCKHSVEEKESFAYAAYQKARKG